MLTFTRLSSDAAAGCLMAYPRPDAADEFLLTKGLRNDAWCPENEYIFYDDDGFAKSSKHIFHYSRGRVKILDRKGLCKA